jgi:hypothetical protein
MDADVVVGHRLPVEAEERRHAWVVFRDATGTERLYEPTWPDLHLAVRPLAEVAEHYVPEWGIDRCGRGFAFLGYLFMELHKSELRSTGTISWRSIGDENSRGDR